MLTLAIAVSVMAGPTVLPDVNGVRRTVVGDPRARGTVALLVFKDCPIARRFAPEIRRIHRDYSSRGLIFFTVFVESISVADAKQHLKEFQLEMPGIIDKTVVVKLAEAKAVPTAAVFSPSGELVYSGRIDDRFPSLGVLRAPRTFDLRQALDQFLSGKPVTKSRTSVVGCVL